MQTNDLTIDSKNLFISLVNDAPNWSDTPMFKGDQHQAGNLTDLKRKGLIKTFADCGCIFVVFTELGIKYANELGLDLN